MQKEALMCNLLRVLMKTNMVDVSSLIVATAALFVAVRSFYLSKASLQQAKLVAERASTDWRQQQWFRLFLAANTARDRLERYQAEMSAEGEIASSDAREVLTDTVLLMEEARGLAMVFPGCPEVDALRSATTFPNTNDYRSRDKLGVLSAAVKGLRVKALVSPEVL